MKRITLFGMVMAILLPTALSAQDAEIVGYARSETQQPVRGAIVQIEALNLSTLTNDQGRYSLTVPASQVQGQEVTIRASSIGYRPTEVTLSLTVGSHQVDILMPTQALALDEVIVTGTAGRQELRAQGATVARVDAARLAEVAPVMSVTQMLQSRVPGLMLREGSGSVGTSQTVRIRGTSSVSLSNNPIYFIDGVRMDSRSTAVYGVGGQSGSRLHDLRVEDIERIEVVKGPAAATLYGSDASGGVIQIFTKRGRPEGGFTQTITTEMGWADPAFTPPANWATCTQDHIDEGRPICQGVAPGTAVSDNPLVRADAFGSGFKRGLTWSIRGGGDRYATFISFGQDREDGTLPNNWFGRTSARANVDFTPTDRLRFEADFGLIRSRTRLPHNDNNIYGWLGGGFLGNPLTVGFTPNDGWYAGNRHNDAISSIETFDTSHRIQPRFAVNYDPVNWFSNRFQIGADITRTDGRRVWPRNDEGWYDAVTLNSGQVSQARIHRSAVTAEYRGNIAWQLSNQVATDLSFGTQLESTTSDNTNATGIGLVSNTVRGINAAAERTGGQSFSEVRRIGAFGQTQFTIWDRLYLTLAGRVDQASAFGVDADPFFSPSIQASYVISEEPFFYNRVNPSLVSDLRLRGGHGVTGNTPSSGARATFSPQPYAISGDEVASGVVPQNPGNAELKAERGSELELGFDAGLLRDRLGLEVTYFRSRTRDLIFSYPLAPSLGFSQNPFFNVGEVENWGWEVVADARLITLPNFGMEVRASYNTLSNMVNDMGDAPATNTVREGFPLGGQWGRTVREFNLEEGYAIVSDTTEYMGPGINMPGREGTFGTTLTFFRNFVVSGQFDYRGDVFVFNSTDQFRERQMGTGERYVKRDELPDQERIHRFGDFINEDTGADMAQGLVNEAYVERGDFIRFREVSLSYRVPEDFAERYLRVRGATVSLAGRNLDIWTDYSGLDPETGQFLTVPQDRRWTARLHVNF